MIYFLVCTDIEQKVGGEMENKNKKLYLLSSNASKEYILDVLEVLSLPFGMVQHFRYQLRWLDNEVKENLPYEKEQDKIRKLIKGNYEIVICYLFQKQLSDGEIQWVAIYPLRIGNLVYAYKTGENDYDIAHFYFEVRNYISNCEDIISQIKGEGVIGKNLVFLNHYSPQTASKEDNYSAFSKICDSLPQEHFKSPDEKVEYYPLFCFIDGLNSINEHIPLKYDVLSRRTYYEISEGSKYSFKFKIFFPKTPPEFSIIIKKDEKLFSTPAQYTYKILSKYTEENCLLISRFLERDVYTSLYFKTDCKSFDSKEPLNFDIEFLVKIKRKLLFRMIEVMGDIGFGVGTSLIALSKMLGEKWDWWYWPVIISYGIWIISKLTTKLLWRG